MRWTWVLMLGLAAAWPSIASEQQSPQADALQAKARQVVQHSAELSTLWPGYWPASQGFVLYEADHGAVLVGADGQPGTLRYQPGILPGADTTFVFDYPAGSPNMMLMTVDRDWQKSAETLFHEQFHDFQDDAFVRSDSRHGGEDVDLSAIPDRQAFTAAAELERRVLADALAATSDAARTDLSRRYVALRRERNASVGESIVAKERYRERSEGTAHFIGLTAASIVVNGDDTSVGDMLVDGLRRDLIAAEGSYSTNWFRWRAYDVGGGIAWLLDQSGGDWKTRAQAGEALDVVLEDRLDEIDADTATTLVRTTRQAYDADALLIEITQALADAPADLETAEDFLALGGRRLVLEVDVPLARAREVRQFSNAKTMTALGQSAMAFPDAIAFQMEKPGILLRLDNMSVMTQMPPSRGRTLRMIYTVLLKDGTDLANLDTLPSGEHSLASLALSDGGLTLDIDQPVVVTVTEDQITIRTSIAAETEAVAEP